MRKLRASFRITDKIYQGAPPPDLALVIPARPRLGILRAVSMQQWLMATLGIASMGERGAGEATCEAVDDWIFEEMAEMFVLHGDNREFFEKNNPWALEELASRLMEAQARNLWQAAPEVLKDLKRRYLELEGILRGDI